MKKLYFDINAEDGLSVEEVEKIRGSALRLIYNNMHPRYHYAVVNLYTAANALVNEMQLDENRSRSTEEHAKL